MQNPEIVYRFEALSSDSQAVREMVSATGFFRPDEVDIAVELVEERLGKGESSGYFFVFAEVAGNVAGYVCYGPVPCTIGSFDLYWIAVDPRWQGRGIGQALMVAAESEIRTAGGRHIYIDTSGRPQYEPTRAFYKRCDYEVAVTLRDFYNVGDDKVLWRKVIN